MSEGSIDIGHVTPFHVLSAVKNDRPFVVTQGGKPVGYFSPYDGKTVTIDLPTGDHLHIPGPSPHAD